MAREVWAAVLILVLASCASHISRKEWIQGTGSGYPLQGRAEVVRDKYGVPHIRADNEKDLFFALGYAMAQDRFMQMDVFRRAGRGELCQLFGRLRIAGVDLLTADRFMRALNYKGRAEQGYRDMPEDARTLLDAFTNGVNRYLKDAGDTIPQYHFLRVGPVEWRPEDSLVCADIFGLSMTANQFGIEYYYTRFVREFGPEKAKVFLPTYPGRAPVVVNDLPTVKADPAMENMFAALMPLLNLGGTPGSNNWVVAPAKSASGQPIICNDPHVPIYPMPTFWYHCQLEGRGFHIIGMMFPGLPAFGAAYNGNIAWALTNAFVDHSDIFIEKINPQNPGQYFYKGKWENFVVRNEEIALKRGKHTHLVVREGLHGPVIDQSITGYPLSAGASDQVYTVKLVDVDLGRFLQGYLDMARAKNWEQWVAGLENMHMGPVAWNHVFADKSGNIGYWLTGHIPIRPDKQGWMARRGWTGDQDWAGYIPLQELPHMFNPGQKFIATANNLNYPDSYPYYLGAKYFSDRIQRIDEVLRSKDRFSTADMENLQLDVAVVWARTFVPVFISDLEKSGNKKAQKALAVLKEWQKTGYLAGIDSTGASLYEVMNVRLGELTFRDELGHTYTNIEYFEMGADALQNIIEVPDNPWYDNIRTPGKETRQDMVEQAAIESVKYLEKKLGRDPEKWQWGKLSHSYFYTPAGFIPLFGKGHRIGKFPREGMSGTVNNNEGIFLDRFGHIFVLGPTTRMIVDFGDPGHFKFTATTGNSENLRSGRSGNLTGYWVKGEYLTLSMNPGEYEKGAMGILELNP